MKLKSRGWRLALALIAVLAIMRWRLGRPTEGAVQTFVATNITAENRREIADARYPRVSSGKNEDPSRTPADSNEVELSLSVSDRAALVATRLREWEDEDDPNLRPQRTQEVEALLAGPDKLRVVEELPVALMDFAFGLPSFQQWMLAEPKAAADWIGAHPGISEARVLTLLQGWSEKNRDEMRQYFASLPEGEWKQKVMTAACNEARARDPVEAIGWAAQLSADGSRTGLLELATLDWAKRDPTAATQWVGQVTDSVLREHLTGSLTVAYAEVAPARAAEWAIGAVPRGVVLDRAVAEIAGAWAKDEPAAVAEWVMRFPEGAGRDMALGNLLNAWGNRDRATATAWVRMLPDENLRTQAVNLLAALPN